ncbi:MAG: tRNA (mnm(5)s(2)U34)-methyltransferase [Parachlamydiaceae bacterium]
MRSSFPLFQSHLDLAHSYWSQIVQIGDIVIDATCGNGHDTLKLCQLTLSVDRGKVYSFDIQLQAIHSTAQLIAHDLEPSLKEKLSLEQRCHSNFPPEIIPNSVKLIVYNLGYLPGGDKAQTTQRSTTLRSLDEARKLLQPGGVISVTCYCGHEEGAKEKEEVLHYAHQLPPKEWSCSHHGWLNRQKAPSLLIIQKAAS